MPKVSFVMPTHNRGDLIKTSIESIVDQTEKDWELIVVDDHSDIEDKTEEIVKQFNDARIKYYKLPDLCGRGVSCARNFGNSMACSKIIIVSDSDDININSRAEITHNSYLEKKWDVFYGRYQAFKDGGKPFDVAGNDQVEFDLDEYKKRNFIPHGSTAYTKTIAMHYPYNSYLHRSEDYDLFSRIAKDGKKFHFQNEIIFNYRVHQDSLTSGESDTASDIFVKKNRGWIE